MPLPCNHEKRVIQQIKPTINLLTNLDEWHPDILLAHQIQPADYKGGMVFRSAVESIRGSFIASATAGRQSMVGTVLERLHRSRKIAEYQQTSTSNRYDFNVRIQRNPDYFVVIEVKGGEGNSINISERPIWAREFAVWCHLDGAVVNQPSDGAHSILNRLTNEMTRRKKQVDMLIFKDVLCGTFARPCPKYFGNESKMGLETAPDIFLFPSSIPSLADPKPDVHALDDLRLPGLVLDLFDVRKSARAKHLWQVSVGIEEHPGGKLRRIVRVHHQGVVVDESSSRMWRRED